MAKRREKPKLGRKITHTNGLGTSNQGIVKSLLSSQFAYETKEGLTMYCLYDESWKYANKGAKSG